MWPPFCLIHPCTALICGFPAQCYCYETLKSRIITSKNACLLDDTCSALNMSPSYFELTARMSWRTRVTISGSSLKRSPPEWCELIIPHEYRYPQQQTNCRGCGGWGHKQTTVTDTKPSVELFCTWLTINTKINKYVIPLFQPTAWNFPTNLEQSFLCQCLFQDNSQALSDALPDDHPNVTRI
jgi:hypothetical protein